MIFGFRRRRQRAAEQAQRLEAARAAARRARDEAARSHARLEAVRRHVAPTSQAAGDRNHFAELIRDGLITGYGEGAT